MAEGPHFTRESLMALREVENRDYPSLRWGQAICNKYRIGPYPELYHGSDAHTQQVIDQWTADYQL